MTARKVYKSIEEMVAELDSVETARLAGLILAECQINRETAESLVENLNTDDRIELSLALQSICDEMQEDD